MTEPWFDPQMCGWIGGFYGAAGGISGSAAGVLAQRGKARPLPAHIDKARLRVNVELQRLTREIVWGDLTAYARRIAPLRGDAVRDAVVRHLDPTTASIVYIQPKKSDK